MPLQIDQIVGSFAPTMQFMTLNRRLFLQGTSVAALSTVLSAVAINRTRAATARTFNGGRSQVNLNYMPYGGDYPFLNCLKTAESWINVDDSGRPDPSTLDSNGYPKSVSNGGIYAVFFVPSQADRPGDYIITWVGNGTIYCGMRHTDVCGDKTSTNGRGRYEFHTSETRLVVGISATRTPHITDLQVFHRSDETALDAGEVFGVRFKQRLAEANFGVIRFVNWQSSNTTNITTWETRKPKTHVFYGGTEFRSGLFAGETTNVGNAFSGTLPGFELIDKATVIVKFNLSKAGPCTLNVSGTGDISILSPYARALSSRDNSYVVGGTSQNIATMVYDETLNAWLKFGGDIAFGIDNGCPPELMVQLCAEVGAHPYFVTPPLAIDPATDFMPSLAAYCRDEGPSWMIPRFEGPNECWNTGIYSTGYGSAKAAKYGWGADPYNWYGKVMSVLGQAVSATYAGDRAKYQILCGVQTVMSNNASALAQSNPRLSSAKYLAQTASAQSPYTKSAASNWVTHICCAQYYVPSEYGTPQELMDARDFAAADSNVQKLIANAYAETANSGNGPFTLSRVAILYAGWKQWALGFGIKRICGYEGGYSPDFNGGENSQVDKLRAASKLAPALIDFTALNYKNFVDLSDSNFIAEFPSCFLLSGGNLWNIAWSVLDDIYQTPNSPQWNAIVAFNHQTL
jgi:hypothetical protein